MIEAHTKYIPHYAAVTLNAVYTTKTKANSIITVYTCQLSNNYLTQLLDISIVILFNFDLTL